MSNFQSESVLFVTIEQGLAPLAFGNSPHQKPLFLIKNTKKDMRSSLRSQHFMKNRAIGRRVSEVERATPENAPRTHETMSGQGRHHPKGKNALAGRFQGLALFFFLLPRLTSDRAGQLTPYSSHRPVFLASSGSIHALQEQVPGFHPRAFPLDHRYQNPKSRPRRPAAFP